MNSSRASLEVFAVGLLTLLSFSAVFRVVPVFGTGDHLRIYCVIATHVTCYGNIGAEGL